MAPKRWRAKGVIVKRLVAIENFGKMSILCVDKTGTITEGVSKINSFVDPFGEKKDKVFEYAFLNSSFQSGYVNPIDQAIIEYDKFSVGLSKT